MCLIRNVFHLVVSLARLRPRLTGLAHTDRAHATHSQSKVENGRANRALTQTLLGTAFFKFGMGCELHLFPLKRSILACFVDAFHDCNAPKDSLFLISTCRSSIGLPHIQVEAISIVWSRMRYCRCKDQCTGRLHRQTLGA